MDLFHGTFHEMQSPRALLYLYSMLATRGGRRIIWFFLMSEDSGLSLANKLCGVASVTVGVAEIEAYPNAQIREIPCSGN